MSKDNGGAAFPHSFTQDSIGDCSGMTLRDYFAIRCPDSEIGNVRASDIAAYLGNEKFGLGRARIAEREIRCSRRYAYADAMLAERAK